MAAPEFDHSVWGWIVAMFTAVLGWFLRGVRAGSDWGTLQQEVRELRADMGEFKAEFRAHLAQDTEADRAMDVRLTGLSRDLNQLIGEHRAAQARGPQ